MRRLLCLSQLVAELALANVSYWFPISHQFTKPIAPVKPLKAPRQVLVWNQFDQGHFGSVLIEFDEVGDTGKFKRVGQQRVYTLGNWSVTEGQQFCDLLLGNSVMKRVDHTSFLQMGGIDYFPKGAGAYAHHIETAHGLHQNQMVYLEMTSWLLGNEVKEHFGGIIPWDLVAEVKAAPGLTQPQLRNLVETHPNDFRLRIRRSTLRLVAGQYLQWSLHRPSETVVFARSLLPLEEGSPPRPHVERETTPFVFELGRASQMAGPAGEAEQLVPFALAVVNHTRFLFHPYPSTYLPMPQDTVGIHVLSLDKTHTVLFRRKLDLKIRGEYGEDTWLANGLAPVVERQTFRSRLAGVGAIHAAVPGRYSEWGAFEVLLSYRKTFRRDLDLTGFTAEQPIVFRTYGPAMHKATMRKILDLPHLPISDGDFEKIWAALREQGRLDLPKFNLYHDYDLGQQEWKENYGIEPLVVSNLSPDHARHDRHYVLKVLLAMHGNWSLPGLSPEILRATPIALVTGEPSVATQAEALGMKLALPLPGKTGIGKVYLLSFTDLETWKATYPAIYTGVVKNGPYHSGFWERYLLMSALPGL